MASVYNNFYFIPTTRAEEFLDKYTKMVFGAGINRTAIPTIAMERILPAPPPQLITGSYSRQDEEFYGVENTWSSWAAKNWGFKDYFVSEPGEEIPFISRLSGGDYVQVYVKTTGTFGARVAPALARLLRCSIGYAFNMKHQELESYTTTEIAFVNGNTYPAALIVEKDPEKCAEFMKNVAAGNWPF